MRRNSFKAFVSTCCLWLWPGSMGQSPSTISPDKVKRSSTEKGRRRSKVADESLLTEKSSSFQGSRATGEGRDNEQEKGNRVSSPLQDVVKIADVEEPSPAASLAGSSATVSQPQQKGEETGNEPSLSPAHTFLLFFPIPARSLRQCC